MDSRLALCCIHQTSILCVPEIEPSRNAVDWCRWIRGQEARLSVQLSEVRVLEKASRSQGKYDEANDTRS